MNRIVWIVVAFLFFSLNVTAQENKKEPQKIIKLIGKITNKDTGEPIPFTNVGVVGSYIGAASNLDGVFEFKIPVKYSDRKIEASAVGFSTFSKIVAECSTTDTLKIMLSPIEYKIEEVNVEAESLVLQKRIKEAAKHISQNYLQTPFNYDAYYRSEKIVNNSRTKLREAAIRIYDDKGYERADAYQVFKERGYKFLQVRKNFQSLSLYDGASYLDELLEMDIVRGRGNILNANNVNFYELNLDKITQYENDSIWVISYKSKRPTLSTTGDYYTLSYSGKIYIKIKDFAVVKNETQVTASNYSPQGRSFYVNEKRQDWKPLTIKYDFNVIYKQHNDKYYLSYVNYNRQHKLKNKENNEIKKETIKTEMVITKINTKNPEVIEKRAYYEDMPYNEKFWETYNIISDM